jgi:hypothetical protein
MGKLTIGAKTPMNNTIEPAKPSFCFLPTVVLLFPSISNRKVTIHVRFGPGVGVGGPVGSTVGGPVDFSASGPIGSFRSGYWAVPQLGQNFAVCLIRVPQLSQKFLAPSDTMVFSPINAQLP